MKFIYILITVLLYSCANNPLANDMEQFMNQQIIIPSDLNAILKGRDTIITGFTQVPIKLVIWYDSLSCSSCEVSQMYMWNNITAHAESLAEWFSIIFLFTPKMEELPKLSLTLQSDEFNYPLFIDRNANFFKQNNLPKNRHLHCFLLDRDNRVVMVGNPLFNTNLWELYKSTIQKMIINDGVFPEN